MLNKIKIRVEKEINSYLRALNKRYDFDNLSPALFSHIKGFLSQKGKRIRPSLFVAGYLGFAGKEAPGLYTSALSTEFLHNFVLIHDDIVDRSDTRRGSPSMHKMLNKYIGKYKNIKCTGEDLAIVTGDVIYALGIGAFLAIDEKAERKERALKKLLDAAVYTGTGEFLELMSPVKDIGSVEKEDIYKLYDLKTGIYSFSTPLVTGAMLAGAKNEDLDRLGRCGIYLGRAFQIRDDLSDISADGNNRRTILSWYAYNNSRAGAIACVKKEIAVFAARAKAICNDLKMRRAYKDLLVKYSDELAIF